MGTSTVESIYPIHRRERNLTESTPVIRLLGPQDEAAFQDLLYAVYGGTYSYQALYEKGGYANLILARKLIGLGEWNSQGILVSHTAVLFKDSENEFVESGLSFRRPFGRGGAHRNLHLQVWKEILLSLGSEYSFMHQSTTTLHPLAQKYASNVMGARPCGMIVDYTQGESLRGVIANSAKSMHALLMSTCLRRRDVLRTQNIYLPVGFWGDWILSWMNFHPLPRRVHRFELTPRQTGLSLYSSLSFETIEKNEALSFERRRVTLKNEASEIADSEARTRLIHLPCENVELIQEAFQYLLNHRYLPVGFRPNCHRSDEIVFQHFSYPFSHADLFQQIRMADPRVLELVQQWCMHAGQFLLSSVS